MFRSLESQAKACLMIQTRNFSASIVPKITSLFFRNHKKEEEEEEGFSRAEILFGGDSSNAYPTA